MNLHLTQKVEFLIDAKIFMLIHNIYQGDFGTYGFTSISPKLLKSLNAFFARIRTGTQAGSHHLAIHQYTDHNPLRPVRLRILPGHLLSQNRLALLIHQYRNDHPFWTCASYQSTSISSPNHLPSQNTFFRKHPNWHPGRFETTQQYLSPWIGTKQTVLYPEFFVAF